VPPPDDDKGELGLLMPGEPEGPPPPRLGADGAAGAGPAGAAGAGPAPVAAGGAAAGGTAKGVGAWGLMAAAGRTGSDAPRAGALEPLAGIGAATGPVTFGSAM